MPRELDLQSLILQKGAHPSPEAGMCVMEAVAFVAGEKHSDHPVCASPAIADFLRAYNDRLPDERRQALKAYIPRLVGSRATPAIEEARRFLFADWCIRTATPLWLDAAGLTPQAAALRDLPPVRAWMDLNASRTTLWSVRARAVEARQDALRRVRQKAGEQTVAVAVAAAVADAAAAAADAEWSASWDKAYAHWRPIFEKAAGERLEETRKKVDESLRQLLERAFALGGDYGASADNSGQVAAPAKLG